jgi:hypothetical protein
MTDPNTFTDREAKEKICHRALTETCVGSQCMAWRWVEGSFFDTKRGFMVQSLDKHGVGIAFGYCGLAGKP